MGKTSYTSSDDGGKWQENYSDDLIKDQESAERVVRLLVKKFNAVEKSRYGRKAKLRKVTDIKFIK